MNDMGFAPHLVRLLENLFKDQEAAVRIDGETSEWFSVGKGVRQGCILSPYLFNVYAENIMRRVRHHPQRYRDPDNKDFDFFSSLNVGGRKYPELRARERDIGRTSAKKKNKGSPKKKMEPRHHGKDEDHYHTSWTHCPGSDGVQGGCHRRDVPQGTCYLTTTTLFRCDLASGFYSMKACACKPTCHMV
ncbi:hypothetical protein RRG08_053900 [Elysia crispata]|uniref:Reverse transcriptase domain-containing protein n=1 Tax=Elysia crispata TaxID=231223 RepID=A0AAE0ZLZ9_9GAST|nr:hypothetical protein RRG08_053900 [Elysia crispata]